MDKGLTDEEIINSLEVIRTSRNCEECKIRDCEWGKCNCEQITASASLDLINRQKAEIYRLQNIIICFMEALGKVRKLDDIYEISSIPLLSVLNEEIRTNVKSEAYKEFAERLKEKANHHFCRYEGQCYDIDAVEAKYIDVLLKEMVGENVVVRCKDCKHFELNVFGITECKRTFQRFAINDNDYCSYGERKEEK